MSAVPDPSSTSGAIVWRNGRLLDAGSAGISAFDHGLLTGDGVFETLLSRDGVPYAETRHYQRLVRSAGALGLEVPEKVVLGEAMARVLAANDLANGVARIRVTVTGGASPLGSDRGHAEHTALVAASPSPTFEPTVDVVTVPFTRNERGALAGLKTTSYGENVLTLRHARERGGGEAIFGNTRGQLCEGSSTNVFAVFDGKLMTPPLASGCLAGVTRGVVLDLCRREALEVAEREVPLADLEAADEAFLTSTLRCVQGIASVNGVALSAAPGPVTARLAEFFQCYSAEVVDP